MMAKRRGEEPPAGYEANFRNVLQFGYALPIDEGINELRRIHGLDEVKLIRVEWVELSLRGQGN